MDNSDIIKDLLDPLIKFKLIEIIDSMNEKPNKLFDPLFKMLIVYKNYLEGTNKNLPKDCLNITIWNFMIISKTTINYLFIGEIILLIDIIKIYNMEYNKRKLEDQELEGDIMDNIIVNIKKCCI